MIYTLGRVNLLSDSSQTPHLTTQHLARLLCVKQTTIATKGRAIMGLPRIGQFDTVTITTPPTSRSPDRREGTP